MNTRIKKLLKEYIARGKFEEANEIAKSLKRSLSKNEVEEIIKYQSLYCWASVLERTLNRVTVDQEFIDSLLLNHLTLNYWVSDPNDRERIFVLAKRCSDKVLKVVIARFSGEYTYARELYFGLMTKIKPSPEVVDYFLTLIYRNESYGIDFILSFIGKSSKQIQDKIINHYISKGNHDWVKLFTERISEDNRIRE